MHYPHFYTQIPSIKLYDPLSDFLGAFENGYLEISYLDCVKVAGHSCPTVAGAYLMAKEGLEALYGDTLPQRGSVKISMRENEIEGVTGVTGNILSFILGAGNAGGFKGIQGSFSRNNLLYYHADIDAEVKLTRLDTMQSVTLTYHPSLIEANKKIMPLMELNLKGLASKEEKELFHTLWQKRVEKILLSTALHSTIISVNKDSPK